MCYNQNMSSIISLGIVILSMLILAFLQLTPGVFALFRHYANGRFSRKKAAMLSTFFAIGTETVAASLFICALLSANAFFFYSPRPETGFLSWILVGILLALALICLLCYYRSGTGSQLFIPRRCAAALENYAASATTRSDAFVLGALSGVLELPFTLPLYLISAIALIQLTAAFGPSDLLAIPFILAPTAPLFALRLRFRTNYNLADIMRARAHDKVFIRILLVFSYVSLAILFIYLGVLN